MTASSPGAGIFRLDAGQIWPLALTVAIFAALALWETLTPHRTHRPPDNGRLATNFMLGIAVALLVTILPLGDATAALFAAQNRIGLFNLVSAAWPVQLATALLLRSLLGYWTHRASHHFPLLWRLHAVHHNDPVFDLSTSFRNHPLELITVMPVTIALTILFGLSVWVAIAMDTIAYIFSFWQHADVRLPRRLEYLLNRLLVTPAFHRQHHSVPRTEHDSNYGDYLIFWDWVFGTLRSADDPQHAVGLVDESGSSHKLSIQLLRPFRG